MWLDGGGRLCSLYIGGAMAGRGSHWLYSDLLTEPFLRQKYVVEQSTIVSLAAEVGVSSLTVRNSLKQFRHRHFAGAK